MCVCVPGLEDVEMTPFDQSALIYRPCKDSSEAAAAEQEWQMP